MDDLAVVEAFAAYLRRQLGEGGPEVLEVGLGESLRRARADAGIALVAGARSRSAERLFALRSGMRPQWRGRAHLLRGSEGLDLTVWDRWPIARAARPPAGFEVLAVVTTYNEADIVGQQVERLLAGGLRVHVIDNWSTDGTAAIVQSLLGRGRLSMERFPEGGPTPYFELRPLLRRVSEVAHSSGADWVIHHDADEVHGSPWPGVTKRQALWAVERWGFNCVDHTLVDFRPVDDAWRPGADLVGSFEWFEFGSDPAHFTLLRAWKPQAAAVSIAESGGHEVVFEGRRVFPYKFPIRHYSIRSGEHARRKLFRDREPRWSPEEKAMGWHRHYDRFDRGSSFVWDRADLYHLSDLDGALLVQRLSGVGLPSNPRPAEAASASAHAGP